MEKNGIWTELVEVRASEVDSLRRMRPTSMCNLLQETAGKHANYRKIGFREMKAMNRFWALSRLRLQIDRDPHWEERVRIDTWVSSMRGPFSIRNFSLMKADGSVTFASASTMWTCVDAEKRRPARLDAGDFPVLADSPPACGEPEKINIEKRGRPVFTTTVRYSDIDMVGHVNNVQYVTWIMDSYGAENESKELAVLEVNYLGETLLGELVEVCRRSLGDGIDRHLILSGDSDREVIRAQLKWASGG
ncbi:MAG: thioesterase [Saprospiraceae bacterium]|nr:thioesterase [Saprospiraceae bacterium]